MKSTCRLVLLTSAIAFMSWAFVSPTLAVAQAVGNDAVYNSMNGVTFSPSFIDASMLLPPNSTLGRDLCDAIYRLFTGFTGFPPYPAAGAVIDARGVSGTANLSCTHGSPWTEGSTTVTVPSTILLPAGTIVIPSTWVLPSNTKLVGMGDSSLGTTIQAGGSFSGAMLQFGSGICPNISIPICHNISVENLVLDGRGQSITGIVNQYAQDVSYVDHVKLWQIRGTGLLVSGVAGGEGSAQNSGPYSNITFDTGGYAALSSTTCVDLNNVSTRGIHELTCVAETNDALAAVLLDGSNNSIKDVRIVGFYDGIRVGANAPAKSNVLINIFGDTILPSGGQGANPVNVVHISNDTTNGANNVTDLAITGLSNSGGTGTNTLDDQLTGTQS